MFIDVSHLVAPLPLGRYAGACVTDLDGDGLCEVFLGNGAGPNRVLKWVRGMLRDVTPPTLADPNRPATTLAAADVNGDGRDELYVGCDAPHPDRLFAVNPDGTWADLFANPENRSVRNLNPTRSTAAMDRRGAGRFGFIVAAIDRAVQFLEVNDDFVTDVAPATGLDHSGDVRHLLPAPIASHRTDLFVASAGSANALLVPGPNGMYSDAARRYGISTPPCGTAAHSSANGSAAFALAGDDGPHSFRVAQPDGFFTDRATQAYAWPSHTTAVAAADFDNDGHEEILFLNRDEPHRLFRTADRLTLLDAGALATGPEHATAVADFDGDGKIELLLVTDTAVRLFRVAGPEHPWLRVQPLTRFGAPARGAFVRLETETGSQLRVLSGTGGIEPVAHFGLGPNPAPATLTVTWPDGNRFTLPAPPPRQLLRLPYPAG